MSTILIKNGRVIDPANGLDLVADVLVVDGLIVAVRAGISPPPGGPCEVIDAAGLIVAPGLIDVHVHCREPGHEEEETIATASAAAVAGGFTTILAMPNTHPPIDDDTAINYVLHRGREANLARVLPVGCITKAREGKELAEMGAMVEAGAVAFSDDGEGVASSNVMQRALQYVRMLDVPLMQHCQDPELLGSGVMNSGPIAVRLGLAGISAAGEQIMLQRDLELVERTEGPYHAQHISSSDSLDLIRAAKISGLPVSAEATPHHLLLTDAACESYDPNYKMNPPLRRAEDVQALRQAVADGTIDVLATDHAPHAKEEKELEFALAPFGIIGLEAAVGLYAKALIGDGAAGAGVTDWPTLIARMTTGPAKLIRRPLGTLTPGAEADITLINPTANYTVDVTTFKSRSRNCPYHGWTLPAKAVMTIVRGEIKFRNQ